MFDHQQYIHSISCRHVQRKNERQKYTEREEMRKRKKKTTSNPIYCFNKTFRRIIRNISIPLCCYVHIQDINCICTGVYMHKCMYVGVYNYIREIQRIDKFPNKTERYGCKQLVKCFKCTSNISMKFRNPIDPFVNVNLSLESLYIISIGIFVRILFT